MPSALGLVDIDIAPVRHVTLGQQCTENQSERSRRNHLTFNIVLDFWENSKPSYSVQWFDDQIDSKIDSPGQSEVNAWWDYGEHFLWHLKKKKSQKIPLLQTLTIDILKQRGTIILGPYHLSYSRIHRSSKNYKIFLGLSLDCPQSQFVPQELWFLGKA